MKRLTAEEVIRRAGLEDDKIYMHKDTGSIATGKEWKETLSNPELCPPYEDDAFDPEGDGSHLIACAPYRTQDRETGTWIDTFDTLEEARTAIAEYEEEDRKEGNYTPDFYEVAELHEDGEYYAIKD